MCLPSRPYPPGVLRHRYSKPLQYRPRPAMPRRLRPGHATLPATCRTGAISWRGGCVGIRPVPAHGQTAMEGVHGRSWAEWTVRQVNHRVRAVSRASPAPQHFMGFGVRQAEGVDRCQGCRSGIDDQPVSCEVTLTGNFVQSNLGLESDKCRCGGMAHRRIARVALIMLPIPDAHSGCPISVLTDPRRLAVLLVAPYQRPMPAVKLGSPSLPG